MGSRAHQIDMIRALNTMDLRPVIEMTYPFARTAEGVSVSGEWQVFWQICIEG